MRFAVLLLLAFLINFACPAQSLKYTAFTVLDGLPSNNVYRCIEDNSGFLWVATDAGVARFDGKRFQVFTAEQGLPDNEVLAVLKENNGRIWINCFKQSPAYFDEQQNRFINALSDHRLAKLYGTRMMNAYPLPNGGMMYYNEKGPIIFKNKKYIDYKFKNKNQNLLIRENQDGSQLVYGYSYIAALGRNQAGIYYTKQNKVTDSVMLKTEQGILITPVVDDGSLYLFNTAKNKCVIFSKISVNPLRFKKDSISIPEHYYNFSFTRNRLCLICTSGNMYVFDKYTLKQLRVLSGNYLPNSFYNDNKGNLWVSTIDKGLLVYWKDQFAHIKMPEGFNKCNFVSIACKPDGTILAGNYYSEVVEINKREFIVHPIAKEKNTRERKIIVSGNNIFTFSDESISINYTDHVPNHFNGPYSTKTALVYNDSIMITGHPNSLDKLNYITRKLTVLNGMHKRITALAKANDGAIYFGSTDGLYQYNFAKNITSPLSQNNQLLSERVVALCTTPDNLLWVATSNNGIIAVKNGRVLYHITTSDGIINNACRSITAGKPGQVWLGTAQGISIVNYKSGQKHSFVIHNLSVNDGLTSNAVNEMLLHNDTIYAATSNGISVIPANIAIPKFNIPVQLIHININQRDTILAGDYTLRHDQQNIQMQFAGIEINGHFKNLQYTLNKNKNWINLDENTLTLQLSSGRHVVQVRAVDVNGNISNKILTIKFDIATPFWKAIWFWVCAAAVTQIVIIYLINRHQKKRKEAKLVKEIAGVQTAALEQQAFTSLMNPHFMFNALNSIQHYINVQDRQNANRYLSDFASLIRKNFEAAQQSFIPLEQEIENIKIYLRLEQMRFSHRFAYQVIIDESLDLEDWMIPTMIMQPLLENALLHGLMPSAIDGKVIIDLKEQDGDLLLIITDNGIGMANSMALKDANNHKSRGMELIKKRILALSRFGSHAITITMSPAFISEKNPGNQIILFIPHELHQAWLQAQQ